MNPALIGIGAGTALLGQGVNAYGSRQGLQAMAKLRTKQRNEQGGYQQQMDQKLGGRINALDVAGGINDATSRLNAPAGTLAAQMAAQGGGDSSGAGGGQAVDSIVQRGIQQAPSIANMGYQRMLQDSQNEQNTIADKANTAAQYYDAQLRRAGDAGMPSRLIGSTLSAIGPGIATMGLWDDVGISPATEAPVEGAYGYARNSGNVFDQLDQVPDNGIEQLYATGMEDTIAPRLGYDSDTMGNGAFRLPATRRAAASTATYPENRAAFINGRSRITQ